MFDALLPQSLFSNRARRLLRVVLLVYLGLVLCPIHYWPLSPVGDNTWYFALNYAASHHLLMGQDIVWTSGPLTWLGAPQNVGSNLAHAILIQGAFWVVLLVMLWDLFFKSNFALRNLVLFSIFLGLSGALYPVALGLGDILLAGALILLLQFQLRGGMARYLTALALLARPLYRWVARNRDRMPGGTAACALPSSQRLPAAGGAIDRGR